MQAQRVYFITGQDSNLQHFNQGPNHFGHDALTQCMGYIWPGSVTQNDCCYNSRWEYQLDNVTAYHLDKTFLGTERFTPLEKYPPKGSMTSLQIYTVYIINVLSMAILS